MPGALTQHRGTALTEPEKVGEAGLMWCVAGEGQPLETRCKQRETTKKKTYVAGAWTMGAKGWDNTAESTRVPGKDISKEKKK